MPSLTPGSAAEQSLPAGWRTAAGTLSAEPDIVRGVRFDAGLMLGDPRLGLGLGGKAADGGGIGIGNRDFDAEGSIRPRDDAIAGLSMRMCSSHRYYMGARRRKAIAGSGPAAKRGRPALAAAPSRVHSARVK